jgi:hypothetical protein
MANLLYIQFSKARALARSDPSQATCMHTHCMDHFEPGEEACIHPAISAAAAAAAATLLLRCSAMLRMSQNFFRSAIIGRMRVMRFTSSSSLRITCRNIFIIFLGGQRVRVRRMIRELIWQAGLYAEPIPTGHLWPSCCWLGKRMNCPASTRGRTSSHSHTALLTVRCALYLCITPDRPLACKDVRLRCMPLPTHASAATASRQRHVGQHHVFKAVPL